MISFFRRIIGSRIGAVFAIGLLVVIALAFAAGDVIGLHGQGTSGSGDTVATVGGRRIAASTLSQAATTALERVKQDQPTASMQAFLAEGGLDQVLDSVADRMALAQWGRTHGVIAGDRLIDSEIAKLPAFQGPDGRFSQAIFDQLIRQRGINEQLAREDIGQGLVARQLLAPASSGATMARELATRYAALLKESRAGAIATLPAALFAPAKSPDDATLATWYQAHRNRFIRPERRVIRYTTLDAAALTTVAPPTEAEIAARYRQNAPLYQPRESRVITQAILPSEAAAREVVAGLGKGGTLAGAAQARGLAASTLGPLTRQALAAQTDPAIAQAAFAAGKGALAGPLRGALGWYVLHVDRVDEQPARTIDQARGEIVAALAAEKHRQALAAASGEIEDAFDKGTGLADAARRFGLAVAQTGPVTADGAVYGVNGQFAPPVLARVLKTAFAMGDVNQAQIAEVDPGTTYVLFDVARIAASAPPPLADIRNDVSAAYMLDQGFAGAGAAARQVLAAVRKGSALPQALAALGRPLPALRPVAMSRDQIAQLQQQTRQPVPSPLALLFSMAQGTTKLLPDPRGQGWFVVSLAKIIPGTLAPGDPTIAAARRELGSVLGDEYADALRRAIRDEVGVTRNPAAIAAVARQLGGTASTP